MKSHLHVQQLRSTIGEKEPARLAIKGLGLKGPGSSVTVNNTPSFRGAIKKVLHLVEVKEVDGAKTAASRG
ncbi:MAG: 50S ribosomal protein L30 [Polyangiaceae bacterium]